MSDRLTIEQRHNNMAAIRGRDTKPEILVEFHSQHIYLPVSLIYRSAITSIPSLSISLSRKGVRCWCFRIISTGQPRRASRYAFRRTIRKNLGGHFYIDIYIAAIVVLVSRLPLFSFLISFFLRLLPLQGARRIALIPRVLPWAGSFWAFSPCLNHMRKFSS